jgi:ABC-2 type transport system permease protein
VLTSSDVLLLALGGLAGVAIWGALGAIIHNQVGAVITLLAWGFVIDTLLLGLAPSVGRFMPTHASDAMIGLKAHHLLSPGAGAVILIAWATALAAIGIALTARRDIN